MARVPISSSAQKFGGAETRRMVLNRAWLRRGGLALLLLAVTGSVYALTAPFAVTPDDPSLGQLLRGMALIKGIIGVAATGIVLWRLAHPLSGGLFLGYAGGLALSLGAVVFLWSLIHIPAGSLLFYTGLALTLLTGRRDRWMGGRD